MRSNVYLFFDGRCEEAMRFYQQVLGGEMQAMMPHEGSPAAGEVPADLRCQLVYRNGSGLSRTALEFVESRLQAGL